MTKRAKWMIYGANGYAGHLVAAEARRRDLHPVLAGRRAGAVEKVAAELNLTTRVFDLDDARATASALADLEVVANCAGPFAATSAQMIDGCLTSRTHFSISLARSTSSSPRSAATRMRRPPAS